ncbi:nicotinamide riboside transporter PnuC [Roseivirga sp. E12]|uniref:nicotinamide riboside transporter PnuC n=1 Tax=Roseivirga sp. E12 TaxID=2819237 RepID=UPI001ABC94E4|nr:nicotinamide riboside transporter PnuC [Roseivirga sp. E12]MBO3699373.1 nicotinamide mononucleotide transporter [Roseivirga sp. E12]
MQFNEIWQQVVDYSSQISIWELTGLIAGLLAVIYLIRQSIWTWPFGILYVLVSFVVFWQARLYGDFLLHVFFLVLNIYGWMYWRGGGSDSESKIKITHSTSRSMLLTFLATIIGVIVFAQLLIAIPSIFEGVDPPALPYWDSTTSVLSVAGMWLTARKKIDNWYYWFVVDVLATGIYFYKELYFYSALYLVYIGMAVAGYLAWKKTMTVPSK